MKTRCQTYLVVVFLCVCVAIYLAKRTSPVKFIEVKENPVVHTLRKNVIFGLCTGYDAASIADFINTFLFWTEKDTHLVLFVDRDNNFRRSSRITYAPVQRKISSPVIDRFYVYRDWIHNSTDLNKILFIDVRDSFFQGDPFKPMIETGIHLFAEGATLDNEPVHNQGWVQSCAGHDVLQSMLASNWPILNGGIIAATDPAHMLSFLSLMENGLKRGCNDQGLVNVLAFQNLVQDIHIHRIQNESWVLHCLQHAAVGNNFGIDGIGRLRGPNKQVFAIVHQYSPFPMISNIRKTFHLNNSGDENKIKPFVISTNLLWFGSYLFSKVITLIVASIQ